MSNQADAKYLVEYRLPNGETRVAGPYPEDQVASHASDIGGYEGITNVVIKQASQEVVEPTRE